MEPYHLIMIALGVAGFLLQGAILIIGGTWKLAQMEARIMSSITGHREELAGTLEQLRAHATEEANRARREFGETVLAMQAKIHEFEKWSRDHFVRRDSFLQVSQESKQSIQQLGTDIGKRLDRLDEKIDAMQERVQRS